MTMSRLQYLNHSTPQTMPEIVKEVMRAYVPSRTLDQVRSRMQDILETYFEQNNLGRLPFFMSNPFGFSMMLRFYGITDGDTPRIRSMLEDVGIHVSKQLMLRNFWMLDLPTKYAHGGVRFSVTAGLDKMAQKDLERLIVALHPLSYMIVNRAVELLEYPKMLRIEMQERQPRDLRLLQTMIKPVSAPTIRKIWKNHHLYVNSNLGKCSIDHPGYRMPILQAYEEAHGILEKMHSMLAEKHIHLSESSLKQFLKREGLSYSLKAIAEKRQKTQRYVHVLEQQRKALDVMIDEMH